LAGADWELIILLDTFAYDPLTAQLASVLKHYFAVALVMLIDDNAGATPRSPPREKTVEILGHHISLL